MTVDVFEATMQCRFAEATDVIESCYELGEQTLEAAVTVYAAQLRMLGVHRGEPPPHTLTARETSESSDRSFEAGFARAELEAGRPELAQATLGGALDRGLDTIPPDYQSSLVLVGLAILAIELDDAAAARRLLVELEPSAGEVSCTPITGYGPTSLYTGRLRMLVGRFDDAEQHLREALAVTERFG